MKNLLINNRYFKIIMYTIDIEIIKYLILTIGVIINNYIVFLEEVLIRLYFEYRYLSLKFSSI